MSNHRDPILSYDEIAEDLGVHLATVRRNVLPHVPIVHISARRRGVRRSDYERYLAERTARAGSLTPPRQGHGPPT